MNGVNHGFKLCGCDIAKTFNKCGQWNYNWGRRVPKNLDIEIVAVDCFLKPWYYLSWFDK